MQSGSNGQKKSKSLVERLGTFGFTGIALTIFGAVFIEFTVRRGMDPYLANLIQAIISVVMNFIINRRTTWHDRRDFPLWVQVLRYILSKAISIPLNQVFFASSLWVFDQWLGFLSTITTNTLFAYVISTGLIMIYNYLVGDRFVFQKKRTPPNSEV